MGMVQFIWRECNRRFFEGVIFQFDCIDIFLNPFELLLYYYSTFSLALNFISFSERHKGAVLVFFAFGSPYLLFM